MVPDCLVFASSGHVLCFSRSTTFVVGYQIPQCDSVYCLGARMPTEVWNEEKKHSAESPGFFFPHLSYSQHSGPVAPALQYTAEVIIEENLCRPYHRCSCPSLNGKRSEYHG